MFGFDIIVVAHDRGVADSAQRTFYFRDGRLFDSPDEEYG